MPELAGWGSFYAIVGSAAGALIGLQFVGITLIAKKPPLRAGDAGAAFATPTIVHFSTALLLSALLRAPWQAMTPAAILLRLMGVGGVMYSIIVARRMRVQTSYHPELVDWVYFALLPLLGYALLTVSVFAAPSDARGALFGVGTATLLLLFTGIHNAWDSVTYHVLVSRGSGRSERC